MSFQFRNGFLKVPFEEFVLRIRKASPWTSPFYTLGGWQELKCVSWKVSVGLKCVFTSRIDRSLNLVPFYTVVSRITDSVSDISAVNLIVGWCKFACSMKVSMSGLLMSQREKTSSICSVSKLYVLSTFRNILLIMFTSLKLTAGAGSVKLEVGWWSTMFDKKCY